jgi:hypothetical protein
MRKNTDKVLRGPIIKGGAIAYTIGAFGVTHGTALAFIDFQNFHLLP